MKASPIRCLISAGPTREFFDPVRFLSNPSTGKMGYALAQAAVLRGWETHLVSGPVSLPIPDGVTCEQAITGNDMYVAIQRAFADCDILIMTAAIMDYRPKEVSEKKIKKYDLTMCLEMEPVIDVLATVAQNKSHQLVVGFAAETDNLEEYALRKLKSKNADYIVANHIGGEAGAFGRDDNTVTVYSPKEAPLALGPLSKKEIAGRLIEIFAHDLARRGGEK